MAVVGVLTSVPAWFSSQSIFSSLSVLEHTPAEQEGERARRLLQQQLVNLAALGEDHVDRSDTVQFVAGESTAFLDDCFSREKMQELRLPRVFAM